MKAAFHVLKYALKYKKTVFIIGVKLTIYKNVCRTLYETQRKYNVSNYIIHIHTLKHTRVYIFSAFIITAYPLSIRILNLKYMHVYPLNGVVCICYILPCFI